MFLSNLLQAVSITAFVACSGVAAGPTSFAEKNRQAKAANEDAAVFEHVKKSSPGLHFNNERDVEQELDERQAGFRFLNNATSAYQVKSLPDVPFNIGEMYSGLVPIKAGDASRELFFVFQPTVGEPVDEITVWLNGGPGCSSLEGFFQENGLYVWKEGSSVPTVNPYSWVNETNMLWVEQPVGTGYTVGTPTATSEEQIAQDFVGFFKNFQTTFGISNFKIYVTGESYAGRYVPFISAAILDEKDETHFDLKGAMVYDPCIGQFDYVQEQVPTYDFVIAHQELFGFSSSFLAQLKQQHASCGYEKFLSDYLKFPASGVQPTVKTASNCDIFDTAANQAQQINSCFNIYEVNQTCPTPVDPMSDNIFPASPSAPNGPKTNYFNRADVKTALHAPQSVTWTECSNNAVFVGRGGPENEGDLSLDSIQKVLPQVIEATNRTIVINGDLDMIIITNGTLLSIQNTTWNGGLGFQQRPSTPINVDGLGNAGTQHFERGLMWAETFESGHMGPEFQPAVSLRHIQWLLGKRETL